MGCCGGCGGEGHEEKKEQEQAVEQSTEKKTEETEAQFSIFKMNTSKGSIAKATLPFLLFNF